MSWNKYHNLSLKELAQEAEHKLREQNITEKDLLNAVIDRLSDIAIDYTENTQLREKLETLQYQVQEKGNELKNMHGELEAANDEIKDLEYELKESQLRI